MKVIAFYLPQFHKIPENDEWWGPGFTEWTNVKKAEPLFEGHMQPRLPLGDNYYNLMDDSTKMWQANLAKQYGIYGFCYYHYWFDGKLLLEKPMEQMLLNPNIDLPFCVSWANEAWTKAWVGETKVLMPQRYGDRQEWLDHFNYLLPFFKDDRYIKCDGKPLLLIYRAEVIPNIDEMIAYWRELARKEGFPDIMMVHQHPVTNRSGYKVFESFDYGIEFQPFSAKVWMDANTAKLWSHIRKPAKSINAAFEKVTGVDLIRQIQDRKLASAVTKVSFDETWAEILSHEVRSRYDLPGAYCGWDNTPRKGVRGSVHIGATADKFRDYMSRQIVKARDEYGSDFLFLTAWNEWAEGSVMEPDQLNGAAYLEALRDALVSTGEYPQRLVSGLSE